MIKQHDHLIKIILIGSSGVGKSSILMQFAENKFTENYLTTIGVDFRFKTIKHQGKTIKFQIWDTAGQERFRTITSAYYKGADGIVMVYDLEEQSSLDDINNFWIPEAYNYVDKGIDVLLLGNKSDCDKRVSAQKVQSIIDKHHFKHEEVSARTADKIYESISDFGVRILEKRLQKLAKETSSSKEESRPNNVTIDNYRVVEPKSKKNCC